MNVRKHLAGFAIFSVILGSAILINKFLTIQETTLVSVPQPIATSVTVKNPLPVIYRVGQVSLDYINKKSYTVVNLERQPDQPAPETLWITTFYFSPDYSPARGWTTTTEIRQPFARGDHTEFIATAECALCSLSETPGAGYFARVYVSAEYPVNSYPPDFQSNREIMGASSVVIHWPDNKWQVAPTGEKFSR
ncbi:MAG: hypothetical protein QOH25_3470 [Acidobacteriota bacterium]|jgi:hypothetical protein|nr:hypothetical protein [Acidobacteriota bacterium]